MEDKNKIGLFSMILLCLNGIVGSGLFLLPGQVAAISGNWALLVYFAIAAIVFAIAWCFGKCAGHFTRNGGAYLYAKEAFGDFVGFEVGLMRWVVGMIAWAALTVGFVTALGTLFPLVTVTPYKQILIVGIITLLACINAFGVKTVKHVSNLMTVAKLLPLIAFLGFGLFALHSTEPFFANPETLQWGTFGTSALIVFYAFGGFDALPIAATSMKDPKKNIPYAMMSAIFLASLLYFVSQAICIGILGPHLNGNPSPITDVAGILFGTHGKLLVACSMLVAIGGVITVSSFITPRACSSMAEEGMMYPKLFEENKFGAPWLAIFISMIITLVIALSGNFVQLVTISVVSRFAQYISTCLALFAFERKGVMKPFNKPWKRAIPVFALLGIVWLITHAELYQLLWGFGALVLGIPLYFIQKKKLAMDLDKS